MNLIKPSSNKLFALIYGMSGTGKTHLAATYAQAFPNKNVLLIDVDQGSATLLASDLKDVNNLYVVSFDAFKDLDTVFNLCQKNTVDAWVNEIPELKGLLTKPFDCVIWDTWSELQWVMSSELRRKSGLLSKGLTYRDNIQLQHWGQMTDLNKLAAASFKDLPIDSIFIMQSQVTEDSITHQVIKGPAIHGKLVTEFPALFTTVIYTYNNPKGEFCATTLPKLGWPAKVRGKEGKDIINPKIKDLI